MSFLKATDPTKMNYEQKKDLAKDPNTPQKALELLATDENHWIRYCVAGNPNTPQKTLEKLATDKHFLVRKYVLIHPNKTQIIERLVFMTNHLESSDE